MKIEGWKTRSVFERNSIVSQTDISEAVSRLENTLRRTPEPVAMNSEQKHVN